MPFQPRGGFPVPVQLVVDTAGFLNGKTASASGDPTADAIQDARQKQFDFEGPTVHLSIQTDAEIRVYFRLEDFANDAKFLKVTDAFSAPMSVRRVWMRSVIGSANVQLIPMIKGGAL